MPDEPRITTKAVVLMPGANEKSCRERIGHWRHLATTAQNEIAECLNERMTSMAGVDFLPDMVWDSKPWPHDPEELLPNAAGESWAETLELLTLADVLVADFRNIAGEEVLTRARDLLDRLGAEYDRLGDWPVAPIVLVGEPGELSGLSVHPHLFRETKICDTSARSPIDEHQESETIDADDPEIETLASVASILPLARQRHYARQMTSESRKSGFRRAAGQVADAAGKAGMDLVRGWLKRKTAPGQTDPQAKTGTNDDAQASRPSNA